MNQPAMEQLASQLLDGRRARKTLDTAPEALVPANEDEADIVQQLTISGLGGGAGYKIGARDPEAQPQAAPLPANLIYDTGAVLAFDAFSRVGLELEIAFRFGDTVDASATSLDDEAILSRIATVHVTSEIVDSRYADFPHIPKLLQLADLQNNGALVVNEGVPYRADFDYLTPRASFQWGTETVFSGPARNPCGDPRRLVVWLVRTMLARGRRIGAGEILTAGSYTGCRFVTGPGEVKGEFEGLGAVHYTLSAN
jgi:2-keto-4-pentenoate hydratase